VSAPRTLQPRLPLELLKVAVLGLDSEDTWVTELARRIHVNTRLVQRWKHDGGVPLREVDLVCVAAGLHPVEVYGASFHEAWDRWDAHKAAMYAKKAAWRQEYKRKQRLAA
jgi:hypothetical protein